MSDAFAIVSIPTGVRFTVRVVVRARRTEIAGTHGDALRIRVAAPPVDGAANDELVRFVARALRVPVRAVRVAGGLSGRSKTIEVAGIDAATAQRALKPPG